MSDHGDKIDTTLRAAWQSPQALIDDLAITPPLDHLYTMTHSERPVKYNQQAAEKIPYVLQPLVPAFQTTHIDWLNALPHPDAYFAPRSSEWVIVQSEDGLWKPGACPRLDFSVQSGQAAFEVGGGTASVVGAVTVDQEDAENTTQQIASFTFSVPLKVFARPPRVLSFQRTGDEDMQDDPYSTTSFALVEEEAAEDAAMQAHVGANGKKLFTTSPEAIPAIMPMSLLQDLVDRPETIPSTSKKPFAHRACIILIWIVGQAAFGRDQSIDLDSHTIQSGLVWDASARAIFDHLGWRVEWVTEAQKVSRRLFPPPPERRLLTMRGLMEIHIWTFDHFGPSFKSNDDVSVMGSPSTVKHTLSAASASSHVSALVEALLDGNPT